VAVSVEPPFADFATMLVAETLYTGRGASGVDRTDPEVADGDGLGAGLDDAGVYFMRALGAGVAGIAEGARGV
jgi:hypothetical protein